MQRTDEARAEDDGGAEDAQERVGLCVKRCVQEELRDRPADGTISASIHALALTLPLDRPTERNRPHLKLTAGSRNQADVEAVRRAGAICRRALWLWCGWMGCWWIGC